ncbi:MAG TPA: DUF3465 domain-containing protein [Gammaproteobacteria bacterium]
MNRNLTSVAVFAALVALYFVFDEVGVIEGPAPDSRVEESDLRRAFEQRRENYQVRGSGVVTRVLADDQEGSRHQRFILQVNQEQTVLVAHNVDLAPRIASIQVGDVVEFFGEYEWNSQGGVIHWTHHDPDGQHVAGWLEHDGRRYQ